MMGLIPAVMNFMAGTEGGNFNHLPTEKDMHQLESSSNKTRVPE